MEKRESPVHGYGIFLTEDVKRGDKLYDYIGIEMTWNEFKNKYGSYKNNYRNTYPMRRVWKIIVAKEEPFKSINLVNFINTSSEPNVVLKKKVLYALRDIKRDEELFLLYPKDYKL